MSRRTIAATIFAAALAIAAGGCTPDTSALTADWQQRFETEGIVRRADNVIIRHTRLEGPYDKGYKDRLASVIVTKGTVLIHQEKRVLLEITPRTRRMIEVRRVKTRIRIRAVGKRVTEVFSFEPRDDAAGWATDVRAVVARARKSGSASE